MTGLDRPATHAAGRTLPRTGLLLACLAVLLAACSPSRAIEATRVLLDLSSAASGAIDGVAREELTYTVAGRRHRGDLYKPLGSPRAALVLVPGAAPAGRRDPRLVAFARTLARADFAVLVPEIANLRALRVRPADAVMVADALAHLAGPVGCAGLMAISYAAGPALLAALRDDTRHLVCFVVTIGGYYDMTALVTFLTTGADRDPSSGRWRRGRVNRFGKWLFLRNNVELVSDLDDRARLAVMAERKLADPDAPIDDLTGGLGAEGRAIHALLSNRDPARVPGLIAGLPEAVRRDMAALDLKTRDLSRLAAPLILVHGRDDQVIPASESQALAAAAPAGLAELYLIDSLAHVDLGPGDLLDVVTLWRAVYRVLEARDAAPGFTAPAPALAAPRKAKMPR